MHRALASVWKELSCDVAKPCDIQAKASANDCLVDREDVLLNVVRLALVLILSSSALQGVVADVVARDADLGTFILSISGNTLQVVTATLSLWLLVVLIAEVLGALCSRLLRAAYFVLLTFTLDDAITPVLLLNADLLSLPFGKRVSRRGREKRDSEEVWLHNSVYLGGVVHDMRKLWRPYSQSYFWAEPPKIMLGQGVVSTT